MSEPHPLPDGPQGERPADAWPDWAERFIEALSNEGVVLKAAGRVSMSRQAIYDLRKKSPTFAAAWDEALESDENLGMRMFFKRAFEGWDEPILCNGQVVAYRRIYDGAAQLAWFKYVTEKKTSRKGQPPGPLEIAQAVHDFSERARASVPSTPTSPPPEGPKP